MNLLSLLDTLGATPAGSANGPAPALPLPAGRRALLRATGQTGARILAATVPLVAALPAVAAPTETAFDSLTLLLTLADLQEALYARALATAGLVPASARTGLARVQALQRQQAVFLRGLFRTAGAAVPSVPAFDFSGSRNGVGPVLFSGVFATFDGFLQLAQPLADLAGRFYLGQFTALRSNAQLLEIAVRRQAVEARQAAHLRTLRRSLSGGQLPKSWPSPTDPAAAPAALAALAALQAGEDNFNQLVPGTSTTAGSVRYIDFNALFTGTPVQTTALAEAFDEPLTNEQAVALLMLFR